MFWSELEVGHGLPIPGTRPVVVTKGPEAESPKEVANLAPPGVDVVMSSEAWDEFRVPLTPYFMLVDENAQVLGEGSALNWEQLTGLLRQSVAESEDPRHLNTSERARFTDDKLAQSGVEPGDPSLYENPLDR